MRRMEKTTVNVFSKYRKSHTHTQRQTVVTLKTISFHFLPAKNSNAGNNEQPAAKNTCSLKKN